MRVRCGTGLERREVGHREEEEKSTVTARKRVGKEYDRISLFALRAFTAD